MAYDKEIADLQNYLKDADYKVLLTFCLEPKSWDEIRKMKIKQNKLFQILKDLKMSKALEFADGKYFAAQFSKEYVK